MQQNQPFVNAPMQQQPGLVPTGSMHTGGMPMQTGATGLQTGGGIGGLQGQQAGGVAGYGALTVNVIEARNLRSKDAASQNDSYCILNIVDKQEGHSSGHGLFGNKNSDAVFGDSVQTGVTTSNNPMWNQSFTLPIRRMDLNSLHVMVYDHDKNSKDDMIGEAYIPLLGLQTGHPIDQWVQLVGRSKHAGNEGALHLQMSLSLPGGGAMGTGQTGTAQALSGCAFIVNVAEGRNLARKDLSSPPDPYVTLRVKRGGVKEKKNILGGLGKKNKTVGMGQYLRTTARLNTTNPAWGESFQLVSAEPQRDQLCITCYDRDDVSKDDFIGQAFIPLANLATGNVSDQWVRLNGKVGQFDGSVHIVITPQGYSGSYGQQMLGMTQPTGVTGGQQFGTKVPMQGQQTGAFTNAF